VRRPALVVVVAALAVAAPAQGAGWRTHRDGADGFRVSVPRSWRVVPPSTTAVKALADAARKRKQAALETEYAVVVAERRSEPRFAFQAFQWPSPSGSVVPDVTVKVDPVAPATTAKNLPAIAASYVKALAKSKSVHVDAPVSLRLPAGAAVRISGSAPLGKTGGRAAFQVYLLVAPRRLYSLAFRFAPAQRAADARVFAAIAARFALG
jgi:hypothetical protein